MSEEDKPTESRIQFKGGIPMIKFGEEFETWEDARKITYLKKLASAMNEAARQMQDERNEIAKRISFYEQQLENLQQNMTQVKAIMTKSITDSNEQKESHLKTINELQYRVRTQDKVINDLNDKIKILEGE